MHRRLLARYQGRSPNPDQNDPHAERSSSVLLDPGNSTGGSTTHQSSEESESASESEELLPVECMSTEAIERELYRRTGRSYEQRASSPPQCSSSPESDTRSCSSPEPEENPMARRRRLAAPIRADVKLGKQKFTFETNPHVEVRELLQQVQCFPDVVMTLTSHKVICNGQTVCLDQALSSVIPPRCTHAKLLLVEEQAVQPTQRFCVKARSLGDFSGFFRVKSGETVRHLRRRVMDKVAGWTSVDESWVLHLPALPLLHDAHTLADYGMREGDVLYLLPASHPEASRRMHAKFSDEGDLPKPKPLKPIRKGFFLQPARPQPKQQLAAPVSSEDEAGEGFLDSLYSGTVSAQSSTRASNNKPGTKKRKGQHRRCQVCAGVVSVALSCLKQCKCGGMFCGKHRLPECHNCGVDHKAESPSLGPAVAPNKVQAI